MGHSFYVVTHAYGVEFGYSMVDLEEGQAGCAHLSSLWSDNQILDPPLTSVSMYVFLHEVLTS